MLPIKLSIKRLLFFLLWITIISCNEKKPITLAGDDPVPAADFIEFFPNLGTSYSTGDSILHNKQKDSLLIGYKVFTALVPDSVLTKTTGTKAKPKLYAIGKIQVPDAESYLLIKVESKAKNHLLLLSFDKKGNFLASLDALSSGVKSGLMQSFSIDRKYTITRSTQRKNADASLSEGKEVYVLNEAAKTFLLILTEALEDKITELINPIDTLGSKQKFTGDYVAGKMNLVSIRDGRRADRVTFFVHFEKREGACIGELKGEAFWRSATKAEYRQDGDPCVLTFTFTKSSVSLKEHNCGSRRGPDCIFDGQFIKTKNSKKNKKNINKP